MQSKHRGANRDKCKPDNCHVPVGSANLCLRVVTSPVQCPNVMPRRPHLCQNCVTIWLCLRMTMDWLRQPEAAIRICSGRRNVQQRRARIGKRIRTCCNSLVYSLQLTSGTLNKCGSMWSNLWTILTRHSMTCQQRKSRRRLSPQQRRY